MKPKVWATDPKDAHVLGLPGMDVSRRFRIDEVRRLVSETLGRSKQGEAPKPMEHPKGPEGRRDATRAFERKVKEGCFNRAVSRLGVKGVARKASLEFWRSIKNHNPWLTAKEIRALQREVAATRKKQKRQKDRANGVSQRGNLSAEAKWRELEMGDYDEEIWKKKLSFMPNLQIGTFGSDNLAKLQDVQNRLVEVVRLRGGANATETTKHQKGLSLGRTVCSGGSRPRNPSEQHDNYSGTIQLKTFDNPEVQQLQVEVTATLTACIEEAFGKAHWFKVTKECFRKVPINRRLPDSSLPGSNIWWSWNDHKSKPHIDRNAVGPCFVLTPCTYHGAELLCGDLKIPLKAGQVVGGAWQQLPHCNDKLLSGDRYSFVVYFDYRMLQDTYWIR